MHINAPASVAFLLGRCHIRIGRRVHQHLGLKTLQRRLNRLRAGDIQLGTGRRDNTPQYLLEFTP
jgi:hypothetical protein